MNNNNVVFKAKACKFNGTLWYSLRKYIDGDLVYEQFVPEVLVFCLQKILKFPVEIE